MPLVDQKLKELLDIMREGMTRQDFLAAFKEVIEHAKKIEQKLGVKIDDRIQSAEDKLDELEELYKEAVRKVENEATRIVEDNESTLSNIKKWAMQKISDLFLRSHVSDALNQKIEEFNVKMDKVDERIAEISSFIPPDASTVALEASKLAQEELKTLLPTIPKLEEELPKLGEPIRDTLELLPDGEKLKIEAIEQLREELDELKKQIRTGGKTVFVGGGSGGGGRIVKSYDLSTSLDGSTKTFNLPALWRVISVHLSSFPNVLRETTDYTYTPTTVTFTSEIDAATSLASGQTCVVIYSE